MDAPSQNRHRLDESRLTELLGQTWPTVVVTQETQSTNRDLAAAAHAGAPAWALHTTDHQVAGRGRLDRSFEMPDQAGVAVSFLVRPSDDPSLKWTWLPLIVGIAACEAFAVVGVDAVLKWPNDVLTRNQKKFAGILVERAETPDGPAAVLGVGVNVSLSERELPTPSASSLLLEQATTLDRHVIVSRLGQSIRRWVERWEAGENSIIEQAYRERCITIGQEVRIIREGFADVTGVAEGIDEFGCIIVAGQPWSAGDVEHLRPIPAN